MHLWQDVYFLDFIILNEDLSFHIVIKMAQQNVYKQIK